MRMFGAVVKQLAIKPLEHLQQRHEPVHCLTVSLGEGNAEHMKPLKLSASKCGSKLMISVIENTDFFFLKYQLYIMPERLLQPIFLMIQKRQGKEVYHSVFSSKLCRLMVLHS